MPQKPQGWGEGELNTCNQLYVFTHQGVGEGRGGLTCGYPFASVTWNKYHVFRKVCFFSRTVRTRTNSSGSPRGNTFLQGRREAALNFSGTQGMSLPETCTARTSKPCTQSS